MLSPGPLKYKKNEIILVQLVDNINQRWWRKIQALVLDEIQLKLETISNKITLVIKMISKLERSEEINRRDISSFMGYQTEDRQESPKSVKTDNK